MNKHVVNPLCYLGRGLVLFQQSDCNFSRCMFEDSLYVHKCSNGILFSVQLTLYCRDDTEKLRLR